MQQNEMEALLEACHLCPRSCGANRLAGEKGICGCDSRLLIARAALHMWEEPCISGEEGSGTVFFSGCALGCVFCQNQPIAKAEAGRFISMERLVEIFFELQSQGANNINLVTAGHYIPQVATALQEAKGKGLQIPIVYNSGGYELPESLKLLEGLVDIYLPDYKYSSPAAAKEYSNAMDYPQVALDAIREMLRQVGSPQMDETGMMYKGVQVRHLVLPGHSKESRQALYQLYQAFGEQIGLSIMNQYTPMPQVADHPLLSRRVTQKEYESVIRYALQIGWQNALIQEEDAATESFIPHFALTEEQMEKIRQN